MNANDTLGYLSDKAAYLSDHDSYNVYVAVTAFVIIHRVYRQYTLCRCSMSLSLPHLLWLYLFSFAGLSVADAIREYEGAPPRTGSSN